MRRRSRTLAAGARDTVSINFRVPSVLVDQDVATVNVTGTCPSCASPPFQIYSNSFRVLVILPTPTPLPTGTITPHADRRRPRHLDANGHGHHGLRAARLAEERAVAVVRV